MTYKEAREAANLKAHEAYYDAVKRDGVISQSSTAAAVDAALSAFSAAGWELVPMEPTEEMVHAGAMADLVRNQYKAMLAAALKERQT